MTLDPLVLRTHAPLLTTHRIFDEEAHRWVPVSARTWWEAPSQTGDVWMTTVDMSVRVVELQPNQFVPPRQYRT